MINIIFVDQYLQFISDQGDYESKWHINIMSVCLFVCFHVESFYGFGNFQQFLWIVKHMEDISWPRGDTGSRKAHLLCYLHAWEPSK